MSKVVKTAKSRRKMAYIWVAVMSAVVIALMVTEQIALLYVLATLGVTALLVIVAMADLHGAHDLSAGRMTTADDAAALGSGITTTPPVRAPKLNARPSGKRR